MENDPFIDGFPIKNGESFHSFFVCLPEGIFLGGIWSPIAPHRSPRPNPFTTGIHNGKYWALPTSRYSIDPQTPATAAQGLKGHLQRGSHGEWWQKIPSDPPFFWSKYSLRQLNLIHLVSTMPAFGPSIIATPKSMPKRDPGAWKIWGKTSSTNHPGNTCSYNIPHRFPIVYHIHILYIYIPS